jgi:predicted P-loop ATPase
MAGSGNFGGASAYSLWQQRLIRNEKGKVLASLANASIALRLAPEWADVLGYNAFTHTVELLAKPPWGGAAPALWQDADDALAAEWLQHHGINVSPTVAADAAQIVARENSFHPVRDYLDGLVWDGRERLDHWTIDFLGTEDTPYNRGVGARFMISAVARIYQPGCKADCAPILEGEQGIKKSTALRVLGAPWFTDEIAELGTKDAAQQLHGVWIVELAELESMTKAEINKVKAFLSRGTDRFRLPYGRRVGQFPRQCILVGSVNKDAYLRDETGGRRFWPIACGKIDIAGLKAARDQLWAEAVVRFRRGAPWWLETDELVAAAAVEQDARYAQDLWQPEIAAYLVGKSEVTVKEIVEKVLDITVDRRDQQHANRVAACLKALRWKRIRGDAGTDSAGKRLRPWVYRPLDPNAWSTGASTSAQRF